MAKTCKKLVSVILCVIMSFAVLAVCASAVGETFTSADELFTCNVIEEGKVEITQYSAAGKSLVIPETVKDSSGNSYTVVSLGADMLEGNTTIESLSIPGTVKNIRKEQFQSLWSLKTLTLNEGIESIGNSAFWDCKSLETLLIPDSITKLGTFVFADCKALTTVTIGDGVSEISSTSFDSCSKLKTVYLGKNVTSVHETAFRGCDALETVYANFKLATFPVSSVDISDVSFYCYPDSPLYVYLLNLDALVEKYSIERLEATVLDIEKQKYAKVATFDDAVLHKDGLQVIAYFRNAEPVNVTELCKIYSPDSFVYPGVKGVYAYYALESATYYVEVYGISFENTPAEYTLYYKDVFSLGLIEECLPEDATITWKTSDPNVATVDENGNVTAGKKGEVTISAEIDDTDVKISIDITVKYRWWQWIIIIVLFGWIWYI